MELSEFVEKVTGRKLTVYQERMLELFGSLPKGYHIVMGRSGPMILDGNGKRVRQEKEEHR